MSMKLARLNPYIIVASFLLFFMSMFGVGCHRESIESPYTPVQKSQQKTGKPPAIRFGAVHSTFADIYAEPTMSSERLSQCVYGDIVRIEDKKTWWYAVKVGPYPELEGWIHKTVVTLLPANALYLKERSLATIVIRQDKSEVFVWPSQTIDIVMGTELPFLGESGTWYLVRLPSNDVGRITREAVYPIATMQPLIQLKQAPETTVQNVPQKRRDIILTAKKFLGKVYIWGGTTPSGFDCSGLSYFVYKLHGIELPRVSWLQYRHRIGKKIKKSGLEIGDLVFFETYKPGPSHVGIYIGNNQFIHASPRNGVTTSSLNEPYFRKRYIGAKTLFLGFSEG